MDPVHIGKVYAGAVVLVAVAVDQGSLPESLGVGFWPVFSSFFVMLTVSALFAVGSLLVFKRTL